VRISSTDEDSTSLSGQGETAQSLHSSVLLFDPRFGAFLHEVEQHCPIVQYFVTECFQIEFIATRLLPML